MIWKDTYDYCDGFASKTTSKERKERPRGHQLPSYSLTLSNSPPVHVSQEHSQGILNGTSVVSLLLLLLLLLYCTISNSWSVFQTGSPRFPDSPYNSTLTL